MPKTNLIVKDNSLINATYSLNLVEQRLIWLSILHVRTQIFNNINNQSELSYPVQITADSYCNHFNVHRNTSYKVLKDACKTLFHRQFSYQEKRNNGIANVTSRWVSRIAYIEEKSTVELLFSQDVIPLITFLEKHLTSYDLEQVKNLNSIYAVRLYELIVSWRSTGITPLMPILELKNKIGVLVDEYERTEAFKRRVLDFAVLQINEHTDIIATYEQHKQGRTITGFTFTFKQKKKAIKSIKEENASKPNNWQTKGLSDAQYSILNSSSSK
jgi:plasmid replication initiation protein